MAPNRNPTTRFFRLLGTMPSLSLLYHVAMRTVRQSRPSTGRGRYMSNVRSLTFAASYSRPDIFVSITPLSRSDVWPLEVHLSTEYRRMRAMISQVNFGSRHSLPPPSHRPLDQWLPSQNEGRLKVTQEATRPKMGAVRASV